MSYFTELTNTGLDLIIDLHNIDPSKITVTSDGTRIKVDVESIGCF